MVKILIDPGHAPQNTNTGLNGYLEYLGAWKISTHLKLILEKKNVVVNFTRTWDEDPTPFQRGRKAQGYDLFISEHTNASIGMARGVECYYDYFKEYDKPFASAMAKRVSDVMNNPDRGAKTRIFEENGIIYNYYGVIRGAAETNCKHILLVESGFHDNIYDAEILNNDEKLKKIAIAQSEVIIEYLGIKGVEDMTVAEAAKIVQDNAGLDDNTMQYLNFYKFGDDLLLKLARSIIQSDEYIYKN